MFNSMRKSIKYKVESINESNQIQLQRFTQVENYIKQASENLDSGQFDKAIQNCNEALKLDSNNKAVFFNRAQAFIKLKKIDEAIRDFNLAIANDPEYIVAIYNRGNAYYQSDRFEEAVRDYDRILEPNLHHGEENFDQIIANNPEYIVAIYNRGNAYYCLREFEKAVHNYNIIFKLNSNYIGAHFNRGLAYLGLRQHNKAISDFTATLVKEPKNAKAYLNLGLACFGSNNFHDAILYYNKSLNLDSTNTNTYTSRALCKIRLGLHEEAIHDCEKTLKLNSKNADAYAILGLAKMHLGLFEKSIQACERALKLDRKNSKAFFHLGLIKAKSGQYAEAILNYKLALESDQNNIDILFNLGSAYTNSNQNREAVLVYDQILISDQNSVSALINRGNIKGILGLFDQAILDYNQALAIDKTKINALISRGYAKFHLGKYAEAIADYDRALEPDPKNLIALNARGSAEFSLGQVEKAIQNFKQVLSYDAKSVTAYNNLGEIYYFLGDFVESLSNLNAVLKFNPKNIQAYCIRSLVQLVQKQFQASQADLQRAIDLDTKRDNSFVLLAQIASARYHLWPDFQKSQKLEADLQSFYKNQNNSQKYSEQQKLYFLYGFTAEYSNDSSTAYRAYEQSLTLGNYSFAEQRLKKLPIASCSIPLQHQILDNNLSQPTLRLSKPGSFSSADSISSAKQPLSSVNQSSFQEPLESLSASFAKTTSTLENNLPKTNSINPSPIINDQQIINSNLWPTANTALEASQNTNLNEPAKKSWHFSKTAKSILTSLPRGNTLLNAEEEDIKFVIKHYQQHPIPAMDIKRVQIIYNPEMNHSFELRMKLLQGRAKQLVFNPAWLQLPESEEKTQRAKTHALAKELSRPNIDADCPNINLLFLWHGTKPDVVNSILETGFANLATTDSGYFGKGIYSANEAEYAYRVYGKTGIILMNSVAFYSAYPVIWQDHQANLLSGKGNYANYDAHFVPVVSPYSGTVGSNYYPCKPGQAHTYIEVVVFDAAQCIPRYLVELQPALPQSLSLLNLSQAEPAKKPVKKTAVITQLGQNSQSFFAKTASAATESLVSSVSGIANELGISNIQVNFKYQQTGS